MTRNRPATLRWMKELIDHMNQCHEQLQWAGDGQADAFLADSLMVDLSECRKLCEQLKGKPKKPAAVLASF